MKVTVKVSDSVSGLSFSSYRTMTDSVGSLAGPQ